MSKKKYRLLPVSVGSWKVQYKEGIFSRWKNCAGDIEKRTNIYGGTSYDFRNVYMHSIHEGVKYIEERLKDDMNYEKRKKENKEYLRKNKPIEYP